MAPRQIVERSERAGRLGRLDAWRDAHAAPPAPRARRTPKRTGRARPLAAGLLVASLAAGWLAVSRHASTGARSVEPHAPADAPSVAQPASADPLRARLPPGLTCTDASSAAPAVRCTIDGVDVEITLLGRGADAAYRRAAHATTRPAAGGAPECAHGRPDERAWSRPSAPARAVGRYRCTFEHGRAAMWWTDDGLLVHATAPNAELARLFTWWRAQRIGDT